MQDTQDKTVAPAQEEDATSYTIQEAAALTELSEHTLRYYERAGLLPSVERTGTGRHRRYSKQDVQWLIFLRRMRTTGMPIHVLKQYADLLQQGNDTVEARRQILLEHRDAVAEHIAALQDCLDTVEYKIANYDELLRDGPTRVSQPQPKK